MSNKKSYDDMQDQDTPRSKLIQGPIHKQLACFSQFNIFLLALFGLIISISSFVLIREGSNAEALHLTPILAGIGGFGIICVIDAILIFTTMWKEGETVKRKICFAIEIVAVFVIGAIFLVFGVVLLIKGGHQVSIMTSTECKIFPKDYDLRQMFYMADDLYIKMQDKENGIFCMKDDCICDLTESKVDTLKKDYGLLKLIKPKNSDNKINKLQDCNNYWHNNSNVPEQTKALKYFMLQIENEWECSGICNKQPLFMFTNVANSPAKSACIIPVANSLEKNKNIIGSVSVAFGIYTLIITFLCWKVVQKKQDKNKDELSRFHKDALNTKY